MKKLILPLLLLGSISFAQITNSGTIYSEQITSNTAIPQITMPLFDVNTLMAEDEINDQLITKPFRFGKEFDVNLSPLENGKWTTLTNGDRIWQLKVKSKNAKTIHFLFKNYKLSPNAKLYFYNEKREFLGNYTAADNMKHQEVISWPIDGSEIVVEFYEPQTEIGQSTFQISKVIHGYRSVQNIKDLTKGLNTSGHCNVDVNCAAGDDWEIQKKAVAMILSGTTEWCTGTLVNNTANDGTPYFLTANHCYSSATPAWTFRFNWISEQPDCGTTAPSGDGPRIYSLSGAEIMSRNAATDFMLLRLNNEIPRDWDLSFVGWDRSDVAPTNVTGLHHPDGDIMKIAQFYGTTLANQRSGMQGWEIPAWDLGVTEGGSSGSALFNSEGYLVGQLYGGLAACSGTGNNGRYDIYGRFDLSWNGGGTSATRLKDWLDPNNLNPDRIEPFRLSPLQNDAKINRIDIDNTCSSTVAPVVVISNSGTDPLSNLSLKYKYNDDAETILPINETLEPNESRSYTLPAIELPSGTNNLYVEVIYDNDQNPGNNIKNTPIEILEGLDTPKVILTLTTDGYAYENAWTLKNSSNQIVYQSTSLEDDTTYTIEFDNLANDCYTFEITDSYGDGICCSYGNGSYALTLPDGTILKEGAQFGSSESTSFKIETTLSTNDLIAKEIAIYPNPTYDIVTISVPNKEGNYIFEVYSTIGQLLKVGKGNGDEKLNMKTYGKGAYVIKIKTEKGKTISKKIIVK